MPGEILGVVGLPGSGKSILVRAIVGLLGDGLQRRAGHVLFRGKDLAELDEKTLRGIRGYEIAASAPNAKSQLNPLVRVGDLMVAHIRAHDRCSRREAQARAARMLGAIGIGDAEHWLAAYPHELSGGMAQRVCLAIALVHRPPLIIADEPTAGLDVTVQRQVLDLMIELCHESGAAQVLATRELGIVAHYCNRVAVSARRSDSRNRIGPRCAVGPAPPGYSQTDCSCRLARRQRCRDDQHVLEDRPMTEPLVAVEGLVKHFYLKGEDYVGAINGISFEIGRGETLGLVGESGSGKTTVGRCLLRLIEPTSGRIRFERRRHHATLETGT